MAELKKIHLILASVVLLNIETVSSQSRDFRLSAINIDTNQVQREETNTRLTIEQSRYQTSNITNTGKTLISTTYQQYLAKVHGGLLNDTYYFCQDEFYWDLELKLEAGVKIDGTGSPVQVVLTFSNDECQDIKNTVQIVVFIYVVPYSEAPFFQKFDAIVNHTIVAGSSTNGSEYYVCLWFFSNFSDQIYYMYTASNGAIVIVIPKLPMIMAHKMSDLQFDRTFRRLENHKNELFSNKAPLTPSPSMIMSAKGVKIKTR